VKYRATIEGKVSQTIEDCGRRGQRVNRFLLAMSVLAWLAVPVWAQETADDDAQAEVETAEAAEEPAQDADDAELDEQSYEDTDDDFRPSELIPADESIAFPTDI
jgi:Tfp pilus assembly protein PilN